MRPAHTHFDIPTLEAFWQAVDAIAHLRPIQSEADYNRIASLMNALLEVAGNLEQFMLKFSSVPTFFRGERAELTRNRGLNFSRAV